jgi:hypothetical protein
MGRRRHWAGLLCVALGLLPLAFAVATVAPHPGTGALGIPQALGCSGSGQGPIAPVVPSTPGWYRLTPSEGGVLVGTDGFFNLYGSVEGLGVEEAVAGVTVVVRTQADVDVPGELVVLQDKGPSEIRLGWSATEPLAEGTTLTAIVRGSPTVPGVSVGGLVRLTVFGPPPVLPMPSVAFGSWWDHYRGIGSVVRCASDPSVGGMPLGTCGALQPLAFEVSSEYELERQVSLSWNAPGTTGREVAWRVQVTQSPSDADDLPDLPLDVFYTGSLGSSFPGGSIHFSPDAAEVCATVVLTDLRTGEAQSGESCQAVMPPGRTYSDDELASCSAPPSDAAADLWCQLRTAAQRDCVARNREGANAQPIGGCQFGGARSAPGWGLAWAAFALVSSRWLLTRSSMLWRRSRHERTNCGGSTAET